MGKGGRSKNRSKRSSASLPRGIPQRQGGSGGSSPFEHVKSTNGGRRGAKHHVHNRPDNGGSNGKNNGTKLSSLARSIAMRKSHLSAHLASRSKSNKFVDRRIGERTATARYDDGNNGTEVMLRRVVAERVRRSKRSMRFDLNDVGGDGDGDGTLTHRGRAIDESYDGAPVDHRDVMLSDDDDDDDLDGVDTMMHFGGGKFDIQNARERGAYGSTETSMGDAYRSRKEEMDERLRARKMRKAEKLKRREDQEATFEDMDGDFADLSKLLNFRDKEVERRRRAEDRKDGRLAADELEMEEWDREMKVSSSVVKPHLLCDV